MSDPLELSALYHLRFACRCRLVLRERQARGHWRPDVFGLTKDRHGIEVEIKRTLSDFRADQGKRQVRWRTDARMLHVLPRMFFYCVPRKLHEKVQAELPEWAGLLTPAAHGWWFNGVPMLDLVKRSPVNKAAPRYSIKECVKLVELQANAYLAAEGRLHHRWDQEQHRNHDYTI